MPRHVRNFWVEGRVDGRRSPVTGGPRARDGGVSLTLYQREAGAVRTALTIECRALNDGTLRITVSPSLPSTFTCRSRTLQIETKR